MKKFLRSSMFIGAMVAMFVTLSSLFAPSVFAAGNNGSQTTAYRKLWYSALSGCIREYDSWYFDALEGGFLGIGSDMVISADHVRSGQWFATAWSFDWSGTYVTSSGGGAYVENAVDGEYDDGKIWCGEDDNALVSKGLEALQVSKLDVACDYADGHFSSGVFYTDKTKQACVDKYNGDDDIYLNTGRSDYFERLITQKTFGGSVPAGSLNVVTNLEEYYIKKVTFETACAMGEPWFGKRMDYNIVAWNPATNKFEEAGYSQKNSGDHKVYWWGGNSATCQELADSLNKGSSVFNAYRDEKLQDAKDGCVREYNAELDKIKKYRDDYGVIANAGLNFVSTIDHMLNGLTSGKVPTVTYIGAQPGAPLSPPIVEAYTNYIDSQLSTVLAKINGESVYTENAFNQLAAAAKSVLSHSDISDDGTVNSTATDNDIAQAKDWVEKANDLVTVVRENYNSLNSFITSHSTSASGVVTWTYENEKEINVICPGKATLSNEWSDFQKNLPGAPDVDGEFNQDEYIDTQDGDGSTSIELTCMNSGGAESLGWIVCPVLDWMTRASGQLYNNYIVPALQVKPKLFEERTGDSNDTFDVWGIFQGFANVLFIILLLAVIFSQLTGVGIDNYGIKKILPKLLVAAILVNLSYYICVALVDVSNIVGNSLQAMFDGMASGLSAPLPGGGGSGAGATAITAVLILGGLAAVGVAIWQNPAILLTLLVAALGVVISILFLFVILSAREAAIVVLTVISPLAFACYMLPNTKKLFDKWLKIWEGLLLVYPICGLLVGGGNFMSKLMLSATGAGTDGSGFFGSFTAMLIGIVPIFFIPTVLKGSFAAMGNLGAKISGFGDRARGRATGWLKNREEYKNLQQRGLERRTRVRAGLNKDGSTRETNAFGRLIRGGKRNMARSRAQYLKDQDARNRENSLMGVGFDAATIGQTKKAEAEETANYMTLINDKTRNGEDEAALLRMYDGYMNAGNKAGAVAVARIAGRRKDTAASFLNKRVTGYGLSKDEGERLRAFNTAHSDIFRSVAKEVSTGENSKMYKDSTPLGFEFAAQYNRNGENIDYTDWSASRENIQRAVDNYITNSQELVGAKNGSLAEIAQKMEDGTMDETHVARLRNLARETINNRSTTGIWDSTKAENLYKIAGIPMDGGAGGERTAPPVPVSMPSGIAREGETFNTRGENGSSGSGIILDPSGEQARQAMREFDARERARGNRNWPGNSNS